MLAQGLDVAHLAARFLQQRHGGADGSKFAVGEDVPVDEGVSSPPSTLRPINEPGTSGREPLGVIRGLRQGVRHHRDTLRILHTANDTVSVRLEAVQTDGSLRIFEGAYTVHDGTIVSADVHEVTGPEPSPSKDSPYENGDEARAAGVAPIYEGEPGYAPHLDRDGDGVTCEPYPP